MAVIAVLRAAPRLLAAITVVVAVVLTTGCAEIMPTEVRQVERGKISLRPLLDPDSIAIPGTGTTEVIDVLGAPTGSEEASPPPDQRPGTVTTLRYDGLEVVVRELEKPPRAFISDLVITSRDYATELPIGVGTERDDIERVLGEPSGTEGADATYELTDRGDRCIVTYEGDRATRLTFQFG